MQFLQGDLQAITLVVGIGALIVAAARMALMRRGDPMREAFSGLIRLLVVSAAGVALVTILAEAGDAFSAWILNNVPSGANQGGGLADAAKLFQLQGVQIASFLLLILAIIAIIATLIQLFLIIVRGALLVLLVGVWPLAAASSMVSSGSQWFKKITAYLIAFLLYKPAAAICYALAFYLLQNPSSGTDGLVVQLEGVVLIIMATLTLPALLKFVVPAVANAGGISGAEVLAGGAALATGAAAIAATGGGAAAGGGAMASAGSAGGGVAGPTGSLSAVPVSSSSSSTTPQRGPSAGGGGGGGSGGGGGGGSGGGETSGGGGSGSGDSGGRSAGSSSWGPPAANGGAGGGGGQPGGGGGGSTGVPAGASAANNSGSYGTGSYGSGSPGAGTPSGGSGAPSGAAAWRDAADAARRAGESATGSLEDAIERGEEDG